ncbi:MAG: hypothetical protein AMJ53_16730 [Gammaproteobacteria bacterium SG8_11]|nr:MAG: hypothetical protein AMJ53_16730 [Gammaproteobacteria bacterium SG8_11]
MDKEQLELRIRSLKNMRSNLLASKDKYLGKANRQMLAGSYWDAIQTMTTARIEQAKAETIRQVLEIFDVANT